MTATHRVPRYNLTQTVQDLASGVKAGMLKPEMADHIQSVVKKHDGDVLPLPGCHICGAQVMENVVTLRLEIEHDWAKHSRGGQAQQMANAADAVEAARAASLRRARERDEE
jgi:hypothetical protein